MDVEELTARASIRIRRSRADVFAVFADPGSMSRFWFTRVDDGLMEGESSTWSLGGGENALSFDVRVISVQEPERIQIEWDGDDGNPTQVTWTFDEVDDGDTLLTIEESGFTGSSEEIVERVVDSTCGFNQVIVAAKALAEHGVALNVVDDHA